MNAAERAARFGMSNTLINVYISLTILLVGLYGQRVAAHGSLVLVAVLSIVNGGATTRPPKSDSTSGQWYSHEFGKYIAAAFAQVLSFVAVCCLQKQDLSHIHSA